MRKFIPVLLAGMMCTFLLAGCGNASTEGNGGTEGEQSLEEQPEVQSLEEQQEVDESRTLGQMDMIRVSVSSDIASLSPFAITSSGRNMVLPTLYEYLACYDEESETGISGIIMKDYKAVNERTYDITIYDYVYDSAGNHITASDVAWCFNTYHDIGNSGLAYLMESCEAIGEYTVELTIGTTQAGMLENLLCGQVPIMAQAAYESSPDEMGEDPVTTSPYVVTEYVSGSHVTVKKRDDYWQTDVSLIHDVSKANADEIRFDIITEPSQVSLNLETDGIDIAQNLAAIEANRFNDSEEYNSYMDDDVNLFMLFFNMSDDSVFKDNLELRQAIAYAIDTAGLVQGAANGYADVAKAVANRMCVDYNEKWDEQAYYEYDIEKSKELLADSGFDTSHTLELYTYTSSITESMAQIVKTYLSEIGITVNLNILDSAMFQTVRNTTDGFDLLIDSRISNDYVTTMASVLATFDNNTSANFVEDEKYSELARVASSSTGHNEESVDAYMQYTKENVYVYALLTQKNFYVTNSKVASIFVNQKGFVIPGACAYYVD